MEGYFTRLLKILAWTCAVLFVFTTGIALLTFNVEWRLFNPELYLRAFESQNLYERIPALAAETLVSTAAYDPCAERPTDCDKQGGLPGYLKLISAEDWQSIIGAVVSPDMLKSLTEDAFTSTFAYLNGETESAVITMTDFKAHLNGPSGFDAVMRLLHSQPACTFQDILDMGTGDLSGTKHLILCNPPEEMLLVVEPLVRAELQFLAASIPDTVTVIPAGAEGMQNPITTLRVARSIMRFSPILPIGLLFLISVFAVRSLKSWLHWWGIPLLVSGLLGLIFAVAVHPIFLWAFRAYLEPSFSPAIPQSLVDASRDLMNAVLSGVAAPIAFQSILLVLIGGTMVAVAKYKTKGIPQPVAEKRS